MDSKGSTAFCTADSTLEGGVAGPHPRSLSERWPRVPVLSDPLTRTADPGLSSSLARLCMTSSTCDGDTDHSPRAVSAMRSRMSPAMPRWRTRCSPSSCARGCRSRPYLFTGPSSCRPRPERARPPWREGWRTRSPKRLRGRKRISSRSIRTPGYRGPGEEPEGSRRAPPPDHQ